MQKLQSSNKILPLSADDFSNFFGVYYVNVSLFSIPNVKKITELHLLNSFQSNSSIKEKVFIDQNVKPANKSSYSRLEGKIFNNYFHLPSNLFFEDNETYLNTQGLVKRATKMIHFKKDAKTNWQITRKFYSKAKSMMFFNNTRDGRLLNFDSINSFNFKNYVNFQFYAVQILSSLSFYLMKQNSTAIKSYKFSSVKPRKVKVLETKLKNWLDDFFNSNGKDSFSYNSSSLVNCSKTMRSSTTNFF